MQIVVISNDALKDEWLQSGIAEKAKIEWIADITAIPQQVHACIDLLFDTERDNRKEKLAQTNAEVILVNDVTETTQQLPPNFVRINGWPTFLKRNVTEACSNNDAIRTKAEELLHSFNRKTTWVPDIPGFITARVVSTIINEAYFSLEDEISSREEIDIAMKLGTNYPYGPFEWSRLIGIAKIHALLNKLSVDNYRYKPSGLLTKEAIA